MEDTLVRWAVDLAIAYSGKLQPNEVVAFIEKTVKALKKLTNK